MDLFAPDFRYINPYTEDFALLMLNALSTTRNSAQSQRLACTILAVKMHNRTRCIRDGLSITQIASEEGINRKIVYRIFCS